MMKNNEDKDVDKWRGRKYKLEGRYLGDIIRRKSISSLTFLWTSVGGNNYKSHR